MGCSFYACSLFGFVAIEEDFDAVLAGIAKFDEIKGVDAEQPAEETKQKKSSVTAASNGNPQKTNGGSSTSTLNSKNKSEAKQDTFVKPEQKTLSASESSKLGKCEFLFLVLLRQQGIGS